MYGYMNNMDPRGPMHAHRGKGRRTEGSAWSRSVYRPGLGFSSLFLLPGLLFGGWIVIAVAGGLFGTMIMVLGSIFSVAGSVISAIIYVTGNLVRHIFSGIFSAGSIVLGIGIGLGLYYWIRKRKQQQC